MSNKRLQITVDLESYSDLHTMNAAKRFGISPSIVTSNQRREAKLDLYRNMYGYDNINTYLVGGELLDKCVVDSARKLGGIQHTAVFIDEAPYIPDYGDRRFVVLYPPSDSMLDANASMWSYHSLEYKHTRRSAQFFPVKYATSIIEHYLAVQEAVKPYEWDHQTKGSVSYAAMMLAVWYVPLQAPKTYSWVSLADQLQDTRQQLRYQ